MRTKARKLIWSVPLVAALAVVGALALFATLAPNDASAQANVEIPPGMPLGLMAEAYDEGTEQEEIQLDWTEPTDGGSPRWYRIDISTNGGYTWVALESDFRGNSYTHDGLKASQTFHYRVFALNQHGISVVSDVVSGTTADSWIPERPTNLTAEVGASSTTPMVADSSGELEIALEWDAPVDPDGASVDNYVIEYSVDGTVWDPVAETDDTEYDHGGLDAGVKYQYRVSAVNSVGQSGWSSTAKDETKIGAVPGKPDAMLPGVAPLEKNTWLFWEPSDDPMGDAITGYEIEGRPIKVAGPRLFGGEPAPLASLVAVTDPPEVAGVDPPDKTGFITVEGIHFRPTAGIDLGE